MITNGGWLQSFDRFLDTELGAIFQGKVEMPTRYFISEVAVDGVEEVVVVIWANALCAREFFDHPGAVERHGERHTVLLRLMSNL